MTLGASIITRVPEPQLAEQVEGAYLSAVPGINQGRRTQTRKHRYPVSICVLQAVSLVNCQCRAIIDTYPELPNKQTEPLAACGGHAW